MKTAGDLITSTAELTAGMKDRENNFECGLACFVIYSHGNTAAVILYSYGIIRMDRDFNMRAETCECFIYGVIDDLIYKVMKTSRRCRAYIHTGTFSYSLKSFEDLNIICRVIIDISRIFDVVILIRLLILCVFLYDFLAVLTFAGLFAF